MTSVPHAPNCSWNYSSLRDTNLARLQFPRELEAFEIRIVNLRTFLQIALNIASK